MTTRLAPALRHMLLQLPSRSPIVMQMFSSTVRPRNNWLIWNVRARPRRARTVWLTLVISSPLSSTRPEFGFSAPVMRLTSVVLPAPFGPISARRAPRCGVRLTSRVTGSAPKRGWGPPPVLAFALRRSRPEPLEIFAGVFEQPEQAAARKQHDQHQHEADAELPERRRQFREVILQHHVDHGAKERAVRAARCRRGSASP